MSETWNDRFYAFIAEWLRSQGEDVREVTGVSTDTYEAGGCPTCWGNYTYETDINWIDSAGRRQGRIFGVRLEDLF